MKFRWRKQFMVFAYLFGAAWLGLSTGWQFVVRAPWLAAVCGVLLVCGSFCFIAGFLRPSGAVGCRVRRIGFCWLGIFTYAFPLCTLAFLLTHVFAISAFFAVYGIAFALLVVLLVYARWQAHRFHVRTYTVESAKLCTPFRLVFLSDMHFEAQKAYRRLARAVETINALSPDVVLFGGDVLYDRVLTGAPAARVQSLLSALSAPHGVYACLGNHDRDTTACKSYAEVAAFLAGAGVTLLDDKSVTLPFGVLYGRKDRYLKQRLSAAELLQATDAFTVVLDHQPMDIPAVAAAGADLLLCGHTHRGQLVPMPLVHVCNLFYGRRLFGATTAIVTAGFGWYGPPLRLGSTGEICEILLVPQKKNEEFFEKTT